MNKENGKIVELLEQNNDKMDKIINLLETQQKILFSYVARQGLNVLPLLNKDLAEINALITELLTRQGSVHRK